MAHPPKPREPVKSGQAESPRSPDDTADGDFDEMPTQYDLRIGEIEAGHNSEVTISGTIKIDPMGPPIVLRSADGGELIAQNKLVVTFVDDNAKTLVVGSMYVQIALPLLEGSVDELSSATAIALEQLAVFKASGMIMADADELLFGSSITRIEPNNAVAQRGSALLNALSDTRALANGKKATLTLVTNREQRQVVALRIDRNPIKRKPLPFPTATHFRASELMRGGLENARAEDVLEATERLLLEVYEKTHGRENNYAKMRAATLAEDMRHKLTKLYEGMLLIAAERLTQEDPDASTEEKKEVSEVARIAAYWTKPENLEALREAIEELRAVTRLATTSHCESLLLVGR